MRSIQPPASGSEAGDGGRGPSPASTPAAGDEPPVAAGAGARGRIRAISSWLVLAAAIAAAWVVLARQGDAVAQSLGAVSALSILGIVAAIVVVFVANGFVLRTSVAFFDLRLSVPRACLIAAANSLWAFLPASAGLGVKAVYLRHRLGLAYSRFAAVTVATLAWQIVLGVVVAEVILLTSPAATGPAADGLRLALGAIGLVSLLPLVTSVPDLRRLGWVGRRLGRVADGWQAIRAQPARLGWLIAQIALRMAVTALAILLCARATAAPFDLADCAALAAVGPLRMVVNLTPGGLGIREGLQVAAGIALGYPAHLTLTVVLLFSAIYLVVTLALGLPAAGLISRRPA